MDGEPKKPQLDEEAKLNQEMREIEEMLHEEKNEEIRSVLHKKYYVLLRKKLGLEEEGDSLEQEIEEIEEELSKVIGRTLREKYYELKKKKKPKKESEETESEVAESEQKAEAEEKADEKKEDSEKKEDLHAIKKFAVDKETLQKLFETNEGSVHGVLEDLANMLPMYFENVGDEEVHQE
jgi:uncharacterized protein YdiU (UPF0061 family)